MTWAEVVKQMFSCVDCQFNTRQIEYYMVKDDIWPIGTDDGMLCIGCLEKRIGRKLNRKDFSECILNNDDYPLPRSERLMDRLKNNE